MAIVILGPKKIKFGGQATHLVSKYQIKRR